MIRVVSALVGFVLALGCVFCGVQPQAHAIGFSQAVMSAPILAEAEGKRVNPADEVLTTEYGQKIDLNNANVRLFRDVRGFYPTLAKIIVENAPYDSVEDALNIPGLSEKQKSKLKANLDRFTVTPPADVFLQGDDRINPGNY